MAVLIVLGLEKRITQSNCFNALHIWICHKFGINVEEDGHIHSLSSIQPLLLETKALNLAKVRGYLPWSDRVGGYTDDVLGGLVGRSVEGQGGFAGKNAYLALLGNEFPWKHIGNRAIERYANARVVGYGL